MQSSSFVSSHCEIQSAPQQHRPLICEILGNFLKKQFLFGRQLFILQTPWKPVHNRAVTFGRHHAGNYRKTSFQVFSSNVNCLEGVKLLPTMLWPMFTSSSVAISQPTNSVCLLLLDLYLYLSLSHLWFYRLIDWCPIFDFIASIVVLFRIWLYGFSFSFSWALFLWNLTITLCTVICAKFHACDILNLCLNTGRKFMLGLVYISCRVLVPVSRDRD
jgi:hypothetical protein